MLKSSKLLNLFLPTTYYTMFSIFTFTWFTVQAVEAPVVSVNPRKAEAVVELKPADVANTPP